MAQGWHRDERFLVTSGDPPRFGARGSKETPLSAQWEPRDFRKARPLKQGQKFAKSDNVSKWVQGALSWFITSTTGVCAGYI